ncbi:MAG: hypothetical protein ACR2K5_13170 [Pseudolabrys sp.]
MAAQTEPIQVDSATARELKKRAAERGVSVAELVAELVPFVTDEKAVVELDRRWAAIESGQPTVPHEEVKQWLRSWGTPDFRPWSER